jgi:arylsulfatase A-like enzyme
VLPPASPNAPNVLIVILDTVRAASMSFLGYERATTPRLAAFGAEGAVFEQAYSTAPWTLPSHAGMFTGLFPTQTSTDWREPLDERPATLAEMLTARGYRTGAFVANHFYTSYESGLGRGFQRLEDYRVTLRQLLLSTTLTQTNVFFELLHGEGVLPRLSALAKMDLRLQTMWVSDRKEAPEVTRQFLGWQAAIGGERPFFAFLNYYDAHLPYDPPPPWRTRFAQDPRELDRYDGAIAYIDDSLGQLFEELRRRGVLDQTLVIVTSDHGELFGEHELHGHGNSLYLPELHVPLIVRYPARVDPGVRLDTPVTLRDLMATALDAVGHGASAPGTSWLPLIAAVDGASGSPVIAEVKAGINTSPEFPVSRGPMQSLITDSLHYIRNGDAIEELYAWRQDPAENHDLVRSGGAASPIEAMRRVLNAVLAPERVSPPPP